MTELWNGLTAGVGIIKELWSRVVLNLESVL